MYFLVVICLFFQGVLQECYGSYNDGGMTLRSERNLPIIARFVIDPRHMSDSGIKRDWYKRDKDGELLDENQNYTDNILRILIEELVEHFENSRDDRIDTIKEMLELINEFISERFIPTHHQHAIIRIFKHIVELQHKPVMHIDSLVFDKLTDQAKKDYSDGVRVQTKDLERAEHNSTNNQFEPPNPDLVEILFMQLVCAAAESSGTRQELMNQIKEIMVKMDRFFGNDSKYKIVGGFKTLRSTLAKYANNESPLPEIVRFIISLIKGKKHSIQNEYEALLDDKKQEEWKKGHSREKSHVSMWVKKAIPKQKTQEEIAEEKKAKEKKAKKSWFKNEVKTTKEKGLEGLEKTGTDLAKKQFSGAITGFTDALRGMLPFGKG